MRELATKEYTPVLAYAAAILFLGQFLVTTFLQETLAAFAIHLLFVPVLVLLIVRVEAAPWARVPGYAWAGLALVADVVAIATTVAGGDLSAAAALSSLSLVPGAVWVYGASMADDGMGHALGAAAAAGLVFSAAMGLTRQLILVGTWDLGLVLQQLALVLTIMWFGALGKDLSEGRRHFDGPHRVYA